MLASLAWDLLDENLKKQIPHPELTYVAPKYLRLAMGGSHSVYILMRINLQHIGKTLFNYAVRYAFVMVEKRLTLVRVTLRWVPHMVGLSLIEFMDDVEWEHRQKIRRMGTGIPEGWTVESFCEAVRRTKHEDVRVFVVVHMFAGARRDGDVQQFLEEKMNAEGLHLLMISVDLAEDPEWDFANPNTFSRLMGLAEEGLIDIFFGGPPCSTVARSRFVKIPGGPRPLRFRWAIWGRPDLRMHERALVLEANTLWLNFLALAESVASRGGGYLWEHPADPGVDPYPSIWATEEMCNFEDRVGGRRVHLHQCPFGVLAPKLTTLSGNLDDMELVDGVRCPGVSEHHQHGVSIGRCPEGGFYTRRLQTYPPKLCEALACMLMATIRRMALSQSGPTGALTMPESQSAPGVTASLTTTRPAGVALLNEATARGYSVRVHERQAATYVHVDDTVFISSKDDGPLHCDKLLDLTVSGLGAVGFQLTQQSRAGDLEKVVGYEVVGHPAEFRLPVKKMVLLRSALMFGVNQKLVSAAVLRSLLGMWIFGALLRRDLLSIPHAVFRFIEKNEDQVVNWWPVAREEVKAMAHVVPLMVCHVGAPILAWLFSTDAMGENDYDHGGFGIAVTELSDPEVDSLLQQGETLGRSIARLDGLHGAKFPQKALKPTVPYTLLPNKLFEPSRWKRQLTMAGGVLETTSQLVNLVRSSRCCVELVVGRLYMTEFFSPYRTTCLKQRVKEDTLIKYQKSFDMFTEYLQKQYDLVLTCPEDLDLLLMEFRTEADLTKAQHMTLVAAAEFFLPHVKGKLSVCREALRGRMAAEAVRHTAPLTMECAYLFSAWHASQGRPRIGAAMLIQHSTGLRPSELLALQRQDICICPSIAVSRSLSGWVLLTLPK